MLRLVTIGAVFLVASLTRGFWTVWLGRSLICDEHVEKVDGILVDNFAFDYLLFERAESLVRAGKGSRVFVPTDNSSDPEAPSVVMSGVVEVMARVASLRQWELIPIQEIEPISLNAAYQIRNHLGREHIKSVLVVTPAFRSKRSSLIYGTILGRAGIRASCVPVFGRKTPENWPASWHGIQDVIEQFIKLQYYRLYVLPLNRFRASLG